MQQSNNVIPFPKSNVHTHNNVVLTVEEISQIVEENNNEALQNLSFYLAESIMEQMAHFGYDHPLEDETSREFYLLMESINSLVSKYHGREHPLQRLAQLTIEIVSDEEYKFVDPFEESDDLN
jgi:hypothetical protein